MPLPTQPHSQSLDSSLKGMIISFAPVVVWAGVIFWFSSQTSLPSLELSTFDFFLKKTAHITVYAILYYLLHRAFYRSIYFKKPSFYFLVPLLFCIIYAITDEIHQSFTPGRTPSPRDIGYDMLGAGIALLRQYRYI